MKTETRIYVRPSASYMSAVAFPETYRAWSADVAASYPMATQDETPDGTRIVRIVHDGRTIDADRIAALEFAASALDFETLSASRVLSMR